MQEVRKHFEKNKINQNLIGNKRQILGQKSEKRTQHVICGRLIKCYNSKSKSNFGKLIYYRRCRSIKDSASYNKS